MIENPYKTDKHVSQRHGGSHWHDLYFENVKPLGTCQWKLSKHLKIWRVVNYIMIIDIYNVQDGVCYC